MTRECQEIRDLLDSYLGGELLVETNHKVLRHLSTCEHCSAETERRRRMRELLVESMRQELDTVPLRRRIDQAIDSERLWWRRTAQWWMMAAASVAIAVLVWYPRAIDAAAYDDSVADHVMCALETPLEAHYNPARVAKVLRPPFTALAEAMGEWHGDHQLVEAHTCPYNGRDYAHLVFRGGGRTVSLFVEAATRGALPKATVVAPGSEDLAAVYATDRNGYHIDATTTRDHQLFIVSDRSGAEQDAVAKRLLESAASFVKSLEK